MTTKSYACISAAFVAALAAAYGVGRHHSTQPQPMTTPKTENSTSPVVEKAAASPVLLTSKYSTPPAIQFNFSRVSFDSADFEALYQRFEATAGEMIDCWLTVKNVSTSDAPLSIRFELDGPIHFHKRLGLDVCRLKVGDRATLYQSEAEKGFMATPLKPGEERSGSCSLILNEGTRPGTPAQVTMYVKNGDQWETDPDAVLTVFTKR